jgi:hypothetical protein
MNNYQDDLQVIIDQLRAYSDKHNVDIKKALNEVYALIPNKPEPMQEQKQEKKKEKESLDYMDSWLKAIKDMGQNMKGEK